jgi:hypothetical protein
MLQHDIGKSIHIRKLLFVCTISESILVLGIPIAVYPFRNGGGGTTDRLRDTLG